MATFDEGEKPILELDDNRHIVLNKTRARALTEGFGTNETEDWPGLRVAVSVERTQFRGTPVDAIRLDVPKKEETAKALDSAIPF